ncbi:hypothetical protein R69927_05943 [Paraburkholderia domus]|nr:hypothetical protein R69927_05943 [Paraburkholderia domus]
MSRSATASNGFEDRMPIDCSLGARVSGREPLQPDELALQERGKIRAAQLHLIRSVLTSITDAWRRL